MLAIFNYWSHQTRLNFSIKCTQVQVFDSKSKSEVSSSLSFQNKTQNTNIISSFHLPQVVSSITPPAAGT